MGKTEENSNNASRKKLQVVSVQSKLENKSNDYVVDNSADNRREKSQSKILEKLAENNLTDNNSRKTDNDCASAQFISAQPLN